MTNKTKLKESIVKIYETNNFSQFNTVKCNRALNNKLVKDIRESVLKQDLLAYNPILVNSNMEVLDGQHRLQVCKELGHTVFYVVKPQDTANNDADCIRDINVNKKSWTNEDYFNFYVSKGEELYVELKKFCEDNNLSLIAGVVLFSNGKTTGQAFRRGKLERDDKNWEFILKALNATKFSNTNYNLYVMKAFINLLNKRKKAYSAKYFDSLVSKLEFAVSVRWNCEARYLDLLEGKYQIK